MSANQEDEPPHTHTLPSHGPWQECHHCGGSGEVSEPDAPEYELCPSCNGDGGWYLPLPPPSYTISDVEERTP